MVRIYLFTQGANDFTVGADYSFIILEKFENRVFERNEGVALVMELAVILVYDCFCFWFKLRVTYLIL
jgi:hypothetical protein